MCDILANLIKLIKFSFHSVFCIRKDGFPILREYGQQTGIRFHFEPIATQLNGAPRKMMPLKYFWEIFYCFFAFQPNRQSSKKRLDEFFMSLIRKDVSIRNQIKLKKLKIQRMLPQELHPYQILYYQSKFYQCNVAVTNYCSQNLDTHLDYLLIYSLTKH